MAPSQIKQCSSLDITLPSSVAQAALSRSYIRQSRASMEYLSALERTARGRAINLEILRDQFYRVNLYIAKTRHHTHVSSVAGRFISLLSFLSSRPRFRNAIDLRLFCPNVFAQSLKIWEHVRRRLSLIWRSSKRHSLKVGAEAARSKWAMAAERNSYWRRM